MPQRSPHRSQYQLHSPSFTVKDHVQRSLYGSLESHTLNHAARPVEMDPANSRTPSALAASSPAATDPLVDVLATTSSKAFQASRWPRPYAIEKFYHGNDEPWVPSNLINPQSDDHRGRHRPGLGPARGEMGPPYLAEWRPTGTLSSEGDAHDHRVPLPSDSGYGTRHSESASVYDDVDRNGDTQSLATSVDLYTSLPAYPPLRGTNTPRELRTFASSSHLVGHDMTSGDKFYCKTCNKVLKTRSELNKHRQRHEKPYVCDISNCRKGFGTSNDLDRHRRSVHSEFAGEGVRYTCHLNNCRDKPKTWPRADNFRSHLKRVHNQYYSSEDSLDEFLHKPAQTPFPPVLEGVGGSSLDYISSSYETSVGILTTPWPMNRTPRELELSQNKELSMDLRLAPLSQPRPGTHLPTSLDPTILRTSANVDHFNDGVSGVLGRNSPLVDVDEDRTHDVKSTSTSSLEPSSQVRSRPVSTATARGTNSDTFEDDHHPGRTEEALTEPVLALKDSLEPSKAPEKNSEASRPTQSAADQRHSSGLRTRTSRCSLLDGSGCEGPKVSTTRLAGKPDADDVDDEDLSGGCVPPALPVVVKLVNPDMAEIVRLLRKFKEEGQLDLILTQLDSPTPSKASTPPTSIKSDDVKCTGCDKTFNRKCELKKHMKRHEKPYGCTYAGCTKKFGSKNDWKRHENSQHFQREAWRCDGMCPDGPCKKVCNRREQFKNHLQKEHKIEDGPVLDEKVDKCRIGRNCESRFWCGFCEKVIEVEKSAWTERFNHIDDHFLGRNGPKKNIDAWKHVESEQTEMREVKIADQDMRSGDTSLAPSPTATDSSADTSASAVVEAPSGPAGVPRVKRSLTDPDMELPQSKRPKQREQREHDTMTVCICCQCGGMSNKSLATSCVLTGDCSHPFCENCRTELVHVTEKS